MRSVATLVSSQFTGAARKVAIKLGRKAMRRITPMSCRSIVILALAVGFSASAKDQLASQVTVYRDEYGVPHIIGQTEEATFFGYGYAQAEDHLERMMLQ